MPGEHAVFLTQLELKALWVRATGGDTSRDAELDTAGETAVAKVHQAEKRAIEMDRLYGLTG